MTKHQFKGFVHLRDGNVLWASNQEKIFNSVDGGYTWQLVLVLPVSLKSRLKGKTRLGRRFFRMMVNHLQWLENRYLVVMGFGRIFCFDFDKDRALIADSPIQGKRPLAFCKTSDGHLFYGEYRSNPERSPVCIWGSKDNGCTWYSAYKFEGVRHIHGVFEDPFDKQLWVTTGDDDDESAIWRAKPDFSDLKMIVSGGQQARAISLQFSDDKVFYGTDTPLEINYLYSLEKSTLVPEKLAEVDGSVFHSCMAGGQMFFSTACEPSKVNLSGKASVYQVSGSGKVSLLVSYNKDYWHKQLFQYGQVFLASGQNDFDELWMTPFATDQDQESIGRSLDTDKVRPDESD